MNLAGKTKSSNQQKQLSVHTSTAYSSSSDNSDSGAGFSNESSSNISSTVPFSSTWRFLVYLLVLVALLVFLEQQSVIVSFKGGSSGELGSSIGLTPADGVGKDSSRIDSIANMTAKELGSKKEEFKREMERINALKKADKGTAEAKNSGKHKGGEKNQTAEGSQAKHIENESVVDRSGAGDMFKNGKESSSKICPELIHKEELKKRRVIQDRLRKGYYKAGSLEDQEMERELGSIGHHRFRLNETMGKNGEKFILFLLAGGLNNALLALENVMPIAAHLNRTLVIPYLTSEHVHGFGDHKSVFSRRDIKVQMPKNRVRLLANETSVTDETMEMLQKMKFTRVIYKKFDLNSERERDEMDKVSFRSYFRLNDYYNPEKMGWKLQNSAKETPAGRSVKHLRVAFMEDNPEFWARQDVYCPSWTPWTRVNYKGMDEFKFLNQREDILCVGQAYSMNPPIAKGFHANDNKNRMVLFSKELKSTVHQAIFNNSFGSHGARQYRVGHYVAVHNRRGDWKGACKAWTKGSPEQWKVCYPTYLELAAMYNKVVTRPEALKSLLSGGNHEAAKYYHRDEMSDPRAVHQDVAPLGKNASATILATVKNHVRKPFNISVSKELQAGRTTFTFLDSFPTYMATNEKDVRVLEGINTHYKWDTATNFLIDPNICGRASKGLTSYVFLRPAIDMLLMFESGAFIGNEFSSFSRRVKYLRQEVGKPSFAIGKL
eukprot:Nk52_evm1s306 gene=Nk52_evmTU1s306